MWHRHFRGQLERLSCDETRKSNASGNRHGLKPVPLAELARAGTITLSATGFSRVASSIVKSSYYGW
jgi:hypothetical protein